MKYAIMMTNTNENDSSVAFSSWASTFAVAFIRRDSGLLRSVKTELETRFEFLF